MYYNIVIYYMVVYGYHFCSDLHTFLGLNCTHELYSNIALSARRRMGVSR